MEAGDISIAEYNLRQRKKLLKAGISYAGRTVRRWKIFIRVGPYGGQ
jgi:hypothetical protein